MNLFVQLAEFSLCIMLAYFVAVLMFGVSDVATFYWKRRVKQLRGKQ